MFSEHDYDHISARNSETGEGYILTDNAMYTKLNNIGGETNQASTGGDIHPATEGSNNRDDQINPRLSNDIVMEDNVMYKTAAKDQHTMINNRQSVVLTDNPIYLTVQA